MFDAYGNHAKEGLEVQFNVDGLCFQDNGLKRKVKYSCRLFYYNYHNSHKCVAAKI